MSRAWFLPVSATAHSPFARTVRGSTLVERNRDYVMAARVIGLSRVRIMVTHILPNVLGPVLVIATLTLGLAILDEATLSFLGVGLPVTQPSLRPLLRLGNSPGGPACRKCPRPGGVVMVRPSSPQSHVPFRAGASSAVSPSPWIISTGHCTFFSGEVSSV